MKIRLLLPLVLVSACGLPTDPEADSIPPSPLTRNQMISRVLGAQNAYACPEWSDWWSAYPATNDGCPSKLQKIRSIKAGKAIFESGGFVVLRESPTVKK